MPCACQFGLPTNVAGKKQSRSLSTSTFVEDYYTGQTPDSSVSDTSLIQNGMQSSVVIDTVAVLQDLWLIKRN